MTTDDLWDLPRVGPPTVSDGGEVVVVPVTSHDADGTARTRLWRLDGGTPVALTAADANAGAPRVAPDGSAVAFVRAVEARPQLHVLPLDGGEARRVTDLPLGLSGSCRWVDADRVLVVTRLLADEPTTAATAAWRDAADERPEVMATERRLSRFWDTWHTDPLTMHVLLVDVTDPTAEPVDLTPGDWLVPDPLTDPASQLATDGSRLAWSAVDPDGDEDGVPVMRTRVVPLDGSGAVTELLDDAVGGVTSPAFLPDGRLLVRRATERDFYACPADLVVVDVDTGAAEVRLDGTALDLGVDAVAVGPDGTVVVGTEVRGRGRLLVVGPDGGTTVLGSPDTGGVTAPVVAGGRVWGLWSSALQPPEVVEVDADGARTLTSFTAERWGDVDAGRLEELEVAGHGGDPVQVLVLHPPSGAVADAGGTPPLVHLVHGGPHGTFGDGWSWRWAAARWAAEGWTVAMVNFHGSTSFGHDFTRSIHGNWRDAPVADVLAATDVLVARGTADADRVGIAGGSYGGYLVTMLACVDQRWSAVVAHAAVTDLGGMWASDVVSGFADAAGGRPWDEDTTAIDHASPNRHYGGITSPTLVLHGERDLRVPIDQGRALYGVLGELGVPSRFVVFPGENHWVLHRDTSVRWYEEVLGWLHRHLDG